MQIANVLPLQRAAPHLPITSRGRHWFHYPIPHQLQYIVLSCPIAAQLMIPKIRSGIPILAFQPQILSRILSLEP